MEIGVVRSTVGEMEMSWNDSSRLLELRFQRTTHLSRQHGDALVDVLTRSIGADHRPFAVLCDGANLSGADAEYRAITREFFRRHRQDCLVATYHMGAVIRVVAELFRIATGTQLKGFEGEAEARVWLRGRGIAS